MKPCSSAPRLSVVECACMRASDIGNYALRAGLAALTVLVLGVLAVGLTATPAAAQGGARPERAPDSGGAGRDRAGRPTVQMVSRRLEQLLEVPRAEQIASDAIRHARRALGRQRQLSGAGRLDAAERALNIAWAALTLASRKIARTLEEEALAEARRRRATAQQRAERARAALEDAMRQRAEAVARQRADAEAQEPPETPAPEAAE